MAKRILSGKYEVQDLIAQARMGAVYKAWDHALDIVVAIKILHPHLHHDTEFLERFRGEARKTARLRWHENIVQTFSVEHDQGTEYLVMEYFPSHTLRDELKKKGKLQISQAVNIIRQIAHALTYTHSHNIFHRDIQPANILIDDTLKVKLTDFGIAKALDQASFTSTGQLIGTAQYMSPEQARNKTLDVRTDLYSLGVVFQELLTGRNLWEEQTKLEIIGKLQSEQTVPTVVFSSDVPEGIQNVIKDLLRYHPTERIQTAESLVIRLEKLRPVWDPTAEGDSDKTLVAPHRGEPALPEDDQTLVYLPEDSKQPSPSPKGKQKTASPPLEAGPTQNNDQIKLDAKIKPNELTTENTNSLRAPLSKPSKNQSVANAMIVGSLCLITGGGIYFMWSPNEISPTNDQQLIATDSTAEKTMTKIEDQARLEGKEKPKQDHLAKYMTKPNPSATEKVEQDRLVDGMTEQNHPAEEKVEQDRLVKGMTKSNPSATEKVEQDRLVDGMSEQNRLAEENIALGNSLKQLQRSIEQRDLRTLDTLSQMSESRYRMLDKFFETYSTIEASVQNVTRASKSATVTLQITRLIRPNGEVVPPPKLLQKITVVVPKAESGWGPFVW